MDFIMNEKKNEIKIWENEIKNLVISLHKKDKNEIIDILHKIKVIFFIYKYFFYSNKKKGRTSFTNKNLCERYYK